MREKFNYVTQKPIVVEYNFHLDDEVTGTEDYRELFEVLRDQSERDVVRISIQNFGGSLHTCISIVSQIRNSQAIVIGSLTSIAYSQASVIWLACDAQEVQEHQGLMQHDGQGWSGGSFTQQYKQIEHSKKVLEGLYRDVYQNFLTQDEIDSVLNGGEVWLHYEEILERLDNKYPEPEEGEELTEEVLKKLTKSELIELLLSE